MDTADDHRVEPHHKGFPAAAVGRTVSELRGLSLNGVARGDDAAGGPAGGGFGTPVLLLREDALERNLRAMRQFCQRYDLSLSPHVKTTMSPEIIARQLAYGAWAVTVATPTQLRTLRWLGARRIILANQLVDPAAAQWLGEQLDTDPQFEAYCYVDSADGVHRLARTLAARGQRRPLPVLVELGVPGGRTGVRTVAGAIETAGLVRDAAPLRLAGVGGFEGLIDVGGDPDRLVEVESYLLRLRQAADELASLAPPGEWIVTAGGSAYLELVRDLFGTGWRAGRPVRVVLRSGCYVTHDSGGYARFRELVAGRDDPLDLAPALELWARVLSIPEPGLALLDAGRRDVGTDAGFPVPQHLIRSGTTTVVPAPAGEVVALNDQHAYLRSSGLAIGDLVGFGISHPCTTLDKWRLIPLVGTDRRLTGAVRTLF